MLRESSPEEVVRAVYRTYEGAPWQRVSRDDPLWNETWPYSGLFQAWIVTPTGMEVADERVLVWLDAAPRREPERLCEGRPVAHLWSVRREPVHGKWLEP